METHPRREITGGTPAPPPPLITVVICTYNRAGLLAEAIRTACEQELDPIHYEVLVVDNNSTDGTPELVREMADRYPHLRHCVETAQGLSHARNRGWREARGRYVAFFDDDAKAPPQWLAVVRRVIDEHAPSLLGGPYFSFYEDKAAKPAWFLDAYGSREMYDKKGFVEGQPDFSGGNIFILRSLLERVGGFDPHMGMTGETMAYGEETLLQRHIHKNFPEETAWYDPDMFIYHLVRADKMTLAWRARQRFAQGRFSYQIRRQYDGLDYTPLSALKLLLVTLCGFSTRLTYKLLLRDRERHPYAKGYLYDFGLDHISSLGRLREWMDSGRSEKKGGAKE